MKKVPVFLALAFNLFLLSCGDSSDDENPNSVSNNNHGGNNNNTGDRFVLAVDPVYITRKYTDENNRTRTDTVEVTKGYFKNGNNTWITVPTAGGDTVGTSVSFLDADPCVEGSNGVGFKIRPYCDMPKTQSTSVVIPSRREPCREQ